MDEKRFIIKRVFKSWIQFHRYVGDRGWAAVEIKDDDGWIRIKLYREWNDDGVYAFVEGKACTGQDGIDVEFDQEIIRQ